MDWQNRRVLVTGAGGFVGSHLAEALVEAGAQVRALTHYNALNAHGWLDASPHRETIECVWGDVTDFHSVQGAMQGVDVVFHLAALIAIPYSYAAPNMYVRVNVEGTLNVLQAARRLEVERVVHTSTSEVYGTAQYVPIDEAHPLQGQSPYSATKIGADKLAEAFYRSFGVPVATVRPFNVFGPRQSMRAVIPTIITQCLAGEVVRLGSLHPTRDFNYVANTVRGFMLAGATPAAEGQVVNIGSGHEISIGDLAQRIAGLVGREVRIETDTQRLRPEKSEVNRLCADSTRARELLGWAPAVSLEEGLSRTIDWVRNNLVWYNSGVYVI